MAHAVPRKDSRVPVAQRAPLQSGARLLAAQFVALLQKNIRIRAASWKTNVLLLAQAALFTLLIWGVDRALLASRQRQGAYSTSPDLHARAIGDIPDCTTSIYLRRDRPCLTLAYAPQGVTAVEEVVAAVAVNNHPPIAPERRKALPSEAELDDYLLQNPETVLSAVIFDVRGGDIISFTVQTNSSVQWFKGEWQHPNTYAQARPGGNRLLPLQAAVERELSRRLLGDAELSWDPSLAFFPHPSTQALSMIGSIAPTFVLASVMFQFVLQLHDVLHDRESGARQAMQTMGLRTSMYWASWIVFQGLLAVLGGLLLLGFGYLFQFNWLTANSIWLSLPLLTLVPLAMASFGFFLIAFMRKASSSVPVGFTVFVVAWVFLIVIAFGFPFQSKYGPVGRAVFSLFPWSLLSKGISDLAAAAAAGTGLAWADRKRYCVPGAAPPPDAAERAVLTDCTMPLPAIFVVLALQVVGYTALGLYLDAVLPGAEGGRRAPWFFLLPSYWLARYRPDPAHARRALSASTQDSTGLLVDPDVADEMARLKGSCQRFVEAGGANKAGGAGVCSEQSTNSMVDATPPSTTNPAAPCAIELYGLRREFEAPWRPIKRAAPFVAVQGTWLGVREGECFALLGPNGAGKSTTIHCLTGVLPLTSGDAVLHGVSLASPGGMDRARPLLGVCPQFDVLWDQLSAHEHLELFAAIKGIPRAERRAAAAVLLEEVRLSETAHRRAGTYSGGMRRRLSVALALLGDPKVVFLDEPTTGLDPVSRRHLWDLIDRAKRGRAIVLTTHSMEEADILGDRIGIMARGRLRCVGTSLRLKNRFGSGYRVSVRVAAGEAAGPADAAGDGFRIRAVAAGAELAAQDAVPGHQAAERAHRIKAIFRDRLGVEAADESTDYVHFMCPYENEDKMPALFHYLKGHKRELGVVDLQVRQTPLEDVFLVVTRKAELEHAQAEGKFEVLQLVEENVTVKVPLGAEFIKSPSGRLYHIRWTTDGDGRLQLLDYHADPISQLLEASRPGAGEAGATDASDRPLLIQPSGLAPPAL